MNTRDELVKLAAMHLKRKGIRYTLQLLNKAFPEDKIGFIGRHVRNVTKATVRNPETLAIPIPGFNELGGGVAYGEAKKHVKEVLKKRLMTPPEFNNGPFSTLKF